MSLSTLLWKSSAVFCAPVLLVGHGRAPTTLLLVVEGVLVAEQSIELVPRLSLESFMSQGSCCLRVQDSLVTNGYDGVFQWPCWTPREA